MKALCSGALLLLLSTIIDTEKPTVAKSMWNCKDFSAVTICLALTIMSYVTFVDVSNDPLASKSGVWQNLL